MMSKLSGRHLLIFLCFLVQQMVDRPTNLRIKHQFRKATTNLQLIFFIDTFQHSRGANQKNLKQNDELTRLFLWESKTSFHWKLPG